MVANIFQPLGASVDQVFRSAADWVKDGRGGLSDRIWLAGQLDRRAIDKILREGMATGKDPLAIARDLEDYLLPAGRPVRNEKGRIVQWKRDEAGNLLRDARGRLVPANAKGVLTRTPRGGMGSAAARTLARTEVSRAFNEGVRQSAALNPFVAGVRWNLSGSHKDADECEEFASGHSSGMGPGVYRTDEVPQIPAHPNCRCYLTKEVITQTGEVVSQLRQDLDFASTVRIVQPKRSVAWTSIVSLFRAAASLFGRAA